MNIELPSLESVIEYACKFYFSKLLLWGSVVFALWTLIKKDSSNRIYSILKIYLIIELSLGIIDNLISPNPALASKTISYFINFSNLSVALIEFYFFSSLHAMVFEKKRQKLNNFFWIILILFATLIVLHSIINDAKYLLRLTYLFGTLEFLFVFYLSIDYFRQLIKDGENGDLFKRGSFWCFLGALFYCAVSAPFYIVGPNFPTGIERFVLLLPALLYYLPYSILFVSISKALTCKTPIWS